MNGLIKKAGLGAVLAATVITAAAPAEAQRWRRYDRGRGGDVAAGAVLGGIVGLGVGAAIASSNRDRYYDRGYYYGPRPRYRGYYYAPPPPRRYYRAPRYYYGGPGYYAPPPPPAYGYYY
jgi:hypothetical protein